MSKQEAIEALAAKYPFDEKVLSGWIDKGCGLGKTATDMYNMLRLICGVIFGTDETFTARECMLMMINEQALLKVITVDEETIIEKGQ